MRENATKQSQIPYQKKVGKQDMWGHHNDSSDVDLSPSGQGFSSQDILYLQRTIGNQATRKLVNQKPDISDKASSQPTVQRLMSATAFQGSTGGASGWIYKRDTILSEIDEWLGAYDASKARVEDAGKTPSVDVLDRREMILERLKGSIQKWFSANSGAHNYKSAIQTLNREANAELRTVKRLVQNANSSSSAPASGDSSVIQGDLQSNFRHVAGLLDMAVPKDGNKSKFEVVLEFPLTAAGSAGPTGEITLTNEAERDDGKLKAKMAYKFAAKGSLMGYTGLSGGITGFIEAQAGNSNEVMNLFSYALYQKFRESPVIPRGWGNYLWGGSTSDTVGHTLAEDWASRIAKQIFGADGENYVETSFIGGEVSGETDLGDNAKATGKANVSYGAKYDQETLLKTALEKLVNDSAFVDKVREKLIRDIEKQRNMRRRTKDRKINEIRNKPADELLEEQIKDLKGLSNDQMSHEVGGGWFGTTRHLGGRDTKGQSVVKLGTELEGEFGQLGGGKIAYEYTRMGGEGSHQFTLGASATGVPISDRGVLTIIQQSTQAATSAISMVKGFLNAKNGAQIAGTVFNGAGEAAAIGADAQFFASLIGDAEPKPLAELLKKEAEFEGDLSDTPRDTEQKGKFELEITYERDSNSTKMGASLYLIRERGLKTGFSALTGGKAEIKQEFGERIFKVERSKKTENGVTDVENTGNLF